MEMILNYDCFKELSYDEVQLIVGGWSWEKFADFVGGVAVVSSAIPGAQGATIVCGCFYAGYKLGQAISN